MRNISRASFTNLLPITRQSLTGNISRVAISALLMVETKSICLLLKQSRFVNTFCFFGFHFNFMCLLSIIILNYRNWNNKFICKTKKRFSLWLQNSFLNNAKYLSGQNLLPIFYQLQDKFCQETYHGSQSVRC